MEAFKAFYLEWRVLILIIAILIVASILSRLVAWFVKRYLQSATLNTKLDPTRYRFFANSLYVMIWLVAVASIVLLIPKLKALAISMFAGAGILLVFIGLAAQQAFSNIVGGIFIVLFKPFRVGDMIQVGTLEYGIVTDITLRHTIIRNFQNNMIIIPNATINSDTIVNNTIEDTKICRHLLIGISYDSDIDKAIQIIQEVAGSYQHCIDVRTPEQKKAKEDKVQVRVMGFMESSIDLKAYVWIDDFSNGLKSQSDILIAIKKRFDQEGIEIPFPHRTLVYKDKKKNQKEL